MSTNYRLERLGCPKSAKQPLSASAEGFVKNKTSPGPFFPASGDFDSDLGFFLLFTPIILGITNFNMHASTDGDEDANAADPSSGFEELDKNELPPEQRAENTEIYMDVNNPS